MDFARIAITACMILVSGCSTYSVTYLTEPYGATVVHLQNSYVGVGPVRMDYGRSRQYIDANGCFQVQGVKATWLSGATARTEDLIKLCNGPGEYTVSLVRPPEAPGATADRMHGSQVHAQRVHQQQIQHQQEQVGAALLLQGIGNAYTGYQQGKQQAQQAYQQQQLLKQQQEILEMQKEQANRQLKCETRDNGYGGYKTTCK